MVGIRPVIRTYLPELIYGANDGVVTTLAIIAGVFGAQLSAQVVLVLGFANLLADGFSMGASNVLSERSKPREHRPGLRDASRNGIATFIGFVLAGIIPLSAYILPVFSKAPFMAALVLAAATLFLVGAGRALFSDRGALQAGLEMLLIGSAAGLVAYGVGLAGAELTGDRAGG